MGLFSRPSQPAPQGPFAPEDALAPNALIALRHDRSDEMPALWAQLAEQYEGDDRWYLEALGIASDLRPEECFAAWMQATDQRWNTPAGRDIVWRSRAASACGRARSAT